LGTAVLSSLTLSVAAPQPSHKSFKIKRILGKKQKQNRPIPQWIRLRTDNTIRCVFCTTCWRSFKAVHPLQRICAAARVCSRLFSAAIMPSGATGGARSWASEHQPL
jgi:large subunit ribosomal protein L39e